MYDVLEKQDKENSEIFDVDANIDENIEIHGGDRNVQIEDNVEVPLEKEDIAAGVINFESIERNNKTNEDVYMEDIDEDIDVEEEFQSNEDNDSDLDPIL